MQFPLAASLKSKNYAGDSPIIVGTFGKEIIRLEKDDVKKFDNHTYVNYTRNRDVLVAIQGSHRIFTYSLVVMIGF